MYIFAISISVILIIIDQITKILALKFLKPINGSHTVIEGILSLTFVENQGAAFGILQGYRWLFVFLTVVIICFISYYYIKMPKSRPYLWIRVSLVLISAGAIGNCIDRLFRKYVVDFLQFDFIRFPVFNIADIFVVVGTILLAVVMLFFIKEEDNTGSKALKTIDSNP